VSKLGNWRLAETYFSRERRCDDAGQARAAREERIEDTAQPVDTARPADAARPVESWWPTGRAEPAVQAAPRPPFQPWARQSSRPPLRLASPEGAAARQAATPATDASELMSTCSG